MGRREGGSEGKKREESEEAAEGDEGKKEASGGAEEERRIRVSVSSLFVIDECACSPGGLRESGEASEDEGEGDEEEEGEEGRGDCLDSGGVANMEGACLRENFVSMCRGAAWWCLRRCLCARGSAARGSIEEEEEE